eukprot:6182885-Pleurochrysis_carterae.AAC.1
MKSGKICEILACGPLSQREHCAPPSALGPDMGTATHDLHYAASTAGVSRKRTMNGHLVVWFSKPQPRRAPLTSFPANVLPRYRRRSHPARNVTFRKASFVPGLRSHKFCRSPHNKPSTRQPKSLRHTTPRTHEPFILNDYGSNLPESCEHPSQQHADVDDLYWLDQYGTNFVRSCAEDRVSEHVDVAHDMDETA